MNCDENEFGLMEIYAKWTSEEVLEMGDRDYESEVTASLVLEGVCATGYGMNASMFVMATSKGALELCPVYPMDSFEQKSISPLHSGVAVQLEWLRSSQM